MKNKIKNVKIGLDIGVSSVGYSVLDSDNFVLESGVRLFSERDAKNNQERRDARHSRRTIRRRHHRLKRVDRLFWRTGLCDKSFKYTCEKDESPYTYRCKGLTDQLSLDQLAIALRHIAKHRGLQSFDTNISDSKLSKMKDSEKEYSTKLALESKRELLESGKYVCEIQLEELKNNHSVRGHDNVYFTSDFVKEIKAILDTQRKFYPEIITEEFENEYISLVETRREYFEGPGTNGEEYPAYGEAAKSPYGWNSTKEWMENLFMRFVITMFRMRLL
jgi:CRISPR-associated endonuclease Csn1